MSYDSAEQSVYGGRPVECYLFTRGGVEWFLTSADVEIEIPGVGTFTPDAVVGGGQEFRDEDDQATTEIQLPRTSPIVSPYIQGLPVYGTTVAVYRVHRGEEADPICWFSGSVDTVEFKSDSIAVAKCSTVLRQLNRRIPGHAWMMSCNWALYSDECGLDAEDYRDSATITEVDGPLIRSAAFEARDPGYFTGGWIQKGNGDKRFIVNHTGSEIQLIFPFDELSVGDTVGAYRGCLHTRAACTAFGNLPHFTGFEWIPRRDPHSQRMMN